MTPIIDKAIQAASETWNVSMVSIIARARSHVVCKARFAVYRFATCNAGLSYSEAGRIIGRDHGAVSNGIRQLESWMQTDHRIRQEVQNFYARLAEGVNNYAYLGVAKPTAPQHNGPVGKV